jgi:hypothetical protein
MVDMRLIKDGYSPEPSTKGILASALARLFRQSEGREHMNKRAQIIFVNDLMETIKLDIKDRINADKIPEDWDGHELRRYIAYCSNKAITSDMSKKRLHDFNNTILINNL